MKYFSTPTRMAKILKTEKTNIGENVEFVLHWGMKKNVATSESMSTIPYIVKNTPNFMTQQFYSQIFTNIRIIS